MFTRYVNKQKIVLTFAGIQTLAIWPAIPSNSWASCLVFVNVVAV